MVATCRQPLAQKVAMHQRPRAAARPRSWLLQPQPCCLQCCRRCRPLLAPAIVCQPGAAAWQSTKRAGCQGMLGCCCRCLPLQNGQLLLGEAAAAGLQPPECLAGAAYCTQSTAQHNKQAQGVRTQQSASTPRCVDKHHQANWVEYHYTAANVVAQVSNTWPLPKRTRTPMHAGAVVGCAHTTTHLPLRGDTAVIVRVAHGLRMSTGSTARGADLQPLCSNRSRSSNLICLTGS